MESPRFDDVETTFEELYARLDAVSAYLRTFDEAALEAVVLDQQDGQTRQTHAFPPKA